MTAPRFSLLPLRSVLCATDLESDSGHAFERATRLARQHGAELHALHVVGGSTMDALRQWLGTGSSAEQALVAFLRHDHADHRLGRCADANRLAERRV